MWLLLSPHIHGELPFTMLLVEVGTAWLEVMESSLDYELCKIIKACQTLKGGTCKCLTNTTFIQTQNFLFMYKPFGNMVLTTKHKLFFWNPTVTSNAHLNCGFFTA